jgi:hypothetical protein
VSVGVELDVRNHIVSVKVAQTFRNTTSARSNATYSFYVDPGAAVTGLTAAFSKTGNRFLATVQERNRAQQSFRSAVNQGRQSVLVERSTMDKDVFSMSIGTIEPDEDAVIELQYITCMSVWQQDQFVLPHEIAARYGSVATNTMLPPLRATVVVRAEVASFSPEGSRLLGVDCSSHTGFEFTSLSPVSGIGHLELPPSKGFEGRPLVLHIRSAHGADSFQSFMIRQPLPDSKNTYISAVFRTDVPKNPSAVGGVEGVGVGVVRGVGDAARRRVVVLVDNSGSMKDSDGPHCPNFWRAQTAEKVVGVVRNSLNPDTDKMTVVLFNDYVVPPFANKFMGCRAVEWDLLNLPPPCGGTDFHKALTYVFRPSSFDDHPTHVVIVTDADVTKAVFE